MFPGLTKEDVAKLSEEQLEVIARVALDQARTKRELEKKAGGYTGSYLIPIAFLAIASGTGALRSAEYLPFVLIGLFCLIQFHAVGINKRIDAMLKLMALPPEERTQPSGSFAETPHGETL